MSMRTVGRLAREAGLSRTTLLYYDRIGLLRPSGRSASGYRQYGAAAARRLESICRYREAGLTLSEIGKVLDGPRDGTAKILGERLETLNREISRLREQQRTVVKLLGDPRSLRRARALDKRAWKEVLRATGLDEEGMDRWHVEFERMSPEGHRDFLESLGIPPGEIRTIRAWARGEVRRTTSGRRPGRRCSGSSSSGSSRSRRR